MHAYLLGMYVTKIHKSLKRRETEAEMPRKSASLGSITEKTQLA